MSHQAIRISSALAFAFVFGNQGEAQTMAYVLQAEAIGKTSAIAATRLSACDRDLIVIDAAFDGSEERWTSEHVQEIRSGKPGRRVVAYFSIGEAEDYRPYWKSEWDADKDGRPDAGAPTFLQAENPDWEGNYKVNYWDASWQKIVLADLDKIVAQGFDGVYLDIVDAFEFFEYDPATKQWRDGAKNEATGNSFRSDMIAWVTKIAQHARATKADFMVIPQNGEALMEDAAYVKTISAAGVEDVFTTGKKPFPKNAVAYRTDFLHRLTKAGKPVYVIEYPKNEKARVAATKGIREAGFFGLLTDRNLKTLGEAVSK